MNTKDAFYKKLTTSLDETTTFPAAYLYKFIVPTTEGQEAEVKAIFKNTNAKIDTKPSKTGKYISISIKLTLASSKEVIAYYKKVEPIKGIISL